MAALFWLGTQIQNQRGHLFPWISVCFGVGIVVFFALKVEPSLAVLWAVALASLGVFGLGWRLGGKGASGRGVHDRIEEHGLHLWMGFYENAFTLLRECYVELGRDKATCPIAEWTDAFDRNPYVGVADYCNDDQWRPWTADFPVDNANPGDPLSGHNPFWS